MDSQTERVSRVVVVMVVVVVVVVVVVEKIAHELIKSISGTDFSIYVLMSPRFPIRMTEALMKLVGFLLAKFVEKGRQRKKLSR
ncbi:hypothetical protein E2C01_044401 [Portunus trituberculatus]|uniref:Uncharacterized protein n=1 Tax=Portunus trituberculatus TaxID=210409 RepID=A0A5B7FVI2_PORTR|nr:hypothetical protein [Portunus trituberculatus]